MVPHANRSRLDPTSNASYQNLTVAASSDSSKTERQPPLLEKCLPCALLHARDYSHDKRKGGHRGTTAILSPLKVTLRPSRLFWSLEQDKFNILTMILLEVALIKSI